MAQTITQTIVNLNVTVTRAPVPSQLQRSGAIVSVGGTTLTPGTYQYCGLTSDLTSILSGSGNSTELTNMANTHFAQGSAIGFYVLELGAETGVDQGIGLLQTWISNNPGIFYAYLVPAAWDYSKDEVGSVIVTNGGSGYTSAPTVTFSAPTSGTTATGTAIVQNGAVVAVTITNPGSGYTAAPTVSFSGGGGTGAVATANLASALNILASLYSSPTGKTYFHVTTTAANLANYAGLKSVIATVPSPLAPSSEFTAAATFYQWLVNQPGAANKLAPMGQRFLYGVTAWPAQGYNAQITSILSGYGNLVLTGAEGGISTATLRNGTTMDGQQASWWYGIDWFQIQSKQALAAAIINGSNTNPPLLYDQPGINTLLSVAEKTGSSAVSFGCAQSVAVTATDFLTYTTQNPGDYSAGIYNGLAATVVGQNGFQTITFNIDAVQL
ncbi:hypothetical protein [Burkholderia multivorans]|uniref:Uncharacterized protein n=1 Tax=Burkholderia multivorans TaxID=87883 RepID=A0A2S9MBF8_9BURK|nr:hypothetical protein [Burkholderia multivorans]MBU9147425.1 hypothetical protein [Burkholderia multivorans]MBU9525052.1 hypothetical protein [Burkholderia multivorans]MBU9537001.1 hypothetical protein [Burkholderia multivorans]MBU9608645.1 hypothetical protein [Burkholderia multivorans]MBU9635428.1 hypothetical protein [Burkholderia multivorans]